MKLKIFLFLALYSFALKAENINIDLSGQWMFRLDSLDRGISENWKDSIFDEYITLPGALQNQGYGNDVTAETDWLTDQSRSSSWFIHPMYEEFRKEGSILYPNNFQPRKHYVGVAWYKREIHIPEEYKRREILLSFERVHWQSTLWIDGLLVDSCNSLLAPHVYSISKFIRPGKKHLITLRVDNSQIVDVGVNSHAWGDQTMTSWNGIIGEMKLNAIELVSLDDMQIYTDVQKKRAILKMRMKNLTGQVQKVKLTSVLTSNNTSKVHKIVPAPFEVLVTPGTQSFSHEIDLTEQVLLWDEYSPALYKMETVFRADSTTQTYSHTFGVRELSVKGNRFCLNGREIYLRGNVLCGSFPLTGYTSMEYSDWKRIMSIHKYYGLNHIRFHSWTPPRAAFKAADEVGIYLFVETDVWASIRSMEQEAFLQQEGQCVLKEYGNHPSFLFLGIGNELSAKKDITNRLLKEWKKDNRHLYTGLANSLGSITDMFDFVVTREVRSNIGWPPRPECSYFYRNKPSTNFEFSNPVKYPVPLITHEAGQHCAYPTLDQTLKFTGSQLAGYIEIARKQLKERGMLHQWPAFVKASGKLQTIFYKHELETYLRMPKHTGYQLLQLEDFPGQGSALVGVLDYFYDSKGYITPQEFRQFCASKVLLAKLPKFVWTTNEVFNAEILFSNWSSEVIRNASVRCRILDNKGNICLQKIISSDSISRGDAVSLGNLQMALSDIKSACKLTLYVDVIDSDIQNQWSFWVYPENLPSEHELPITTTWNDSIAKEVMEGKTLILQLDKTQIRGNLPPSFLPIYWTQFDKMGNSQTLGILCNPRHPLFEKFPTDFHTDWQWFELLNNAHPLIFDEFDMKDPWNKSFVPLIQLVDGWKTNRKLGVMGEAKLGKGRLIVTSMNLTDSLKTRLVARQFRHSLLNYIQSENFNPDTQVSLSQIDALLKKQQGEKPVDIVKSIRLNNIMSKSKWIDLIDSDKNTIWEGEWIDKKKTSSIVLELNKCEGVGGIIWNPCRIKDLKDLAYRLYLSRDEKDWGIPIVEGNINNKNSQEIDLLYFHRAKYIKIEFPTTREIEKIKISDLILMVE